LHVDSERNRLLFRKLAQLLGRSPSRPQADTIHQFRTLARRVEAVLTIVCPDPGAPERKLLRGLKRLRRHAGAVRDIDVQIAALRKLKIGRESDRRARLMDALSEARAEREQELRDWLTDRRRNRLRRRLSRCAAALDRAATHAAIADSAPSGASSDSDGHDKTLCSGAEHALRTLEPAAEALRRFASMARRARLTADDLHAFRTSCKKVRYIAEMGADERAQHIVESLKRAQDAIGDWHDWDALRATAEDMFGHSVDSALVMALRNVTQAKFEEARSISAGVRKELLAEHRGLRDSQRAARHVAEQPSDSKPPRRKSPRREPAPKALRASNGVA
jgi:CHAD domain-containing protein